MDSLVSLPSVPFPLRPWPHSFSQQQSIHSSMSGGKRHTKKTLKPFSSPCMLLHCHSMTLAGPFFWNAPLPDVWSGGCSSTEMAHSQRGHLPNNLPSQYSPLLPGGQLPIHEITLFVYCLSPSRLSSLWEQGLGCVCWCFFSTRTCPHLVNK